MRIEEPIPDIFRVVFSDQQDLASTFLRFQEYYESPEFHGKVFTTEEFQRWYTANSPEGKATGRFTYNEDWAGFNIPSEVLAPFYEGKFDPLSRNERALLDAFSGKDGRFYIIGTLGEVEFYVIKHEVAHGLFYTCEAYRKNVQGILDEIPKEARNSIRGYLSQSGGYHPSVIDDETHGYILTSLDILLDAGVDIDRLSPVSQKLEKNFSQFSEGKI